MDLIVFNVEHGLCVLVKTPNGYGVMVDAGCSSTFKPAEWASKGYNITLTPFNGYKLARLVVTHPHDDHVEGIESVIQHMPPALLRRHKTYNWKAVLNPPDCDPSENAERYYRWQQGYSGTPASLPDFGCGVESYGLTPAEAEAVGGQMQNHLNNSSLVTVIDQKEIGGRGWKIVICGDNEAAGLRALLAKDSFRNAIRNADIVITPHHGHTSGYCEEFMAALGSPYAFISSTPKGNDHVDDRYRDRAMGLYRNSQLRKHLKTGEEGHLWMNLSPTGYSFQTVIDLPAISTVAGLLGLSLNR